MLTCLERGTSPALVCMWSGVALPHVPAAIFNPVHARRALQALVKHKFHHSPLSAEILKGPTKPACCLTSLSLAAALRPRSGSGWQ